MQTPPRELRLPSAEDHLQAGRDVSWRFTAQSVPGAPRTQHRDLTGPLRLAVLMPRTDICGGARILLEHADRMSARGHDVTVLSYFPRPDWFDLRAPFVQVPTGVRLVDHAPVVDLVLCGYWSLLPEVVAAQLAPVVHFEQGDYHLFEDIAPDVHARVQACLALADAHTVVSGTVSQVLRERFATSASVVPNAVDPEVFHPGPRTAGTRRTVLCVGWDGNAFKGVDDVRAVARGLRTSHPDVDVVWVTPNAPQGAHGEFARVVVAPGRAELAALYREASAYVCASHYESFPLPPMEAMASGTPVVTTANTGSLEYCLDEVNSLLVPVQDPAALHVALSRVLDDDALAAQLVQGGLRTAASYTWDSVMDTAEAAYRACASARATPLAGASWRAVPVGEPEDSTSSDRLAAVLARSGARNVWVPVRSPGLPGHDTYRWKVVAHRPEGSGECRVLAPHRASGEAPSTLWDAAVTELAAGRPAEALAELDDAARRAASPGEAVAIARWAALSQVGAGAPLAGLELAVGLANAHPDSSDLLAVTVVAAVAAGLTVDLQHAADLVAVSGAATRHEEYLADPRRFLEDLAAGGSPRGPRARGLDEPRAAAPSDRRTVADRAPLVSVVMPVHNGARFIEQAARSILAQTVEDLELLVVDDRSDDGSADLVRGLRDPRVRVLACQGRGEGAARNTGLDAARGEWVAWQDSDDVALPHRLQALLAAVAGGADFAHSDLMLIDAEDRPAGYFRSSSIAARAVLPHLLRGGTPFNNPSMLLSRSAIGTLRFDTSLVIGVDTDFVRRFAPHHCGVHVPEPLTLYRRHSDNATARMGQEEDYPHIRQMLEHEPLTALVPEAFEAYPEETAPAVARAVIGLALRRRGYAAAVDWFAAAASCAVDAEAAAIVCGLVDLAVHEDASAVERFRVVSQTPLVLALTGDALMAQGAPAAAAAAYRRALQLQPECYDAISGLRALGEEAGLRVVDDPTRRLLRR